MDRGELKAKLNKFFEDPDWPLVEGILRGYVEPLKAVEGIDLTQDSMAVHAELKGRLAASQALERFLSDVGVLRTRTKEDRPFR